MAKDNQKRRIIQVIPTTEKKQTLLEALNPRSALMVVFVLVILILIVFYKPYVIDRLEPSGGDKMASIAQTKFNSDFWRATGQVPLWNPAIFCGVPTYFETWPGSFHLDLVIAKLNRIIDWRFSWFLLGAVGTWLVCQILGFSWYYALIGIIAFLFFPHYQALITVGHFAKIRAVCALPLVVWGFLYLIKKRNLLAFLLFTLCFSLQLRTQHYQIIFYTLLLLLAIGIWQIVAWIKSKQAPNIGVALGLFIPAIGLAVLMSAQPLFVANEYTPYSTRGGQAINLREESLTSQVKSSGVTFEYATRWSLNPKELVTLIIPRFYGGTSQELYTGKTYPSLRGQYIPGYWGDMPFTQSSEYMGILIVILALLGIWYYRRDGLIISLFILLGLAFLLAFGSHFPILYKALFLYLPYFSKFRVPMMILILINFILIILALYGLKALVEQFDEKKFKASLVVGGFFFILGLFFSLFPGVLSYTSPQDTHYMQKPEVIEFLRTARREFLQADVLRMLAFVAGFLALVTLYYLKKIRPTLLIGGMLLLVAVDLIGVSQRFLRPNELVDAQSLERRYFAETRFDKILREDVRPFRILGLGNLFQSNDLAYRYQIVNGYSPIKPQLIQDLIDNNLFNLPDGRQINWNVVNMLNAKYIVAPFMIEEKNLTILDVDQQRKQVLYLNEAALPRAYFVRQVKRLENERAVVAFLNQLDFDPAMTALVSTPLLDQDSIFAQEGTAEIVQYTPNQVELNVDTEAKGFLILADAYYPKGWQAFIDGQETTIYQVNHVLRGIVVPAGEHQVQFRFYPKSYRVAKTIAGFTTTLVWLAVLGILIPRISFACPLRRRLSAKKP